jgi:hypothetical protein
MNATPGFVDVTGWSAHDVRRLGHMDDEDSAPAPRQRPRFAKRPTRVALDIPSSLAFAAACAAQRINAEYIKVDHLWKEDEVKKTANREIMEQLIAMPIAIRPEDYEQGVRVQEYFQALTFQIIKGRTLSDFQKKLLQIADSDRVTGKYELAVIASMPSSYERGVKSDAVAEKLSLARGGYLGNVGDKVTTGCSVMRSNYSQKWNVYFVTALTDDNQPVFFSYKQALPQGQRVTIAGTVKAQRDGQTQLNRVKII